MRMPGTLNRTAWILLATASLLTSPMATAAPILYDFSGSGTFCERPGIGAAAVCTYDVVAYTGSVVIDVIAPGPNGSDAEITETSARDTFGWVVSDFTLFWNDGANSFNPSPVGPSSEPFYTTQVTDSPGYDSVLVQEFHSVPDLWEYAYLLLESFDDSWLSGLVFPEPITVPSGTSVSAYIQFDSTRIENAGDQQNYFGFSGWFNPTSFTARVEVPGPDSLSLMLLGLLAAAMVVQPTRIRKI